MLGNLGFIEDAMLQNVSDYYSVYTERNRNLSSCNSDCIMSTSQS